MSEDYDDGMREAKCCKNCGGYYPGDCKCSPCRGGENGEECDGCQEYAYIQYGTLEEEDE